MSSRSKKEDYVGTFKKYSFAYQSDRDGYQEESLLDDNEYVVPSYKEKEVAMKKLNDELEKKTSEILKKIEHFRIYEESSQCKNMNGQGDASYSVSSYNDRRYLSNVYSDGYEESQLSPNHYGINYYEPLSRVSTCETETYNGSSSQDSYTSSKKRPATSAGPCYPHYAVTPTEASLAKCETARPLAGVEEKHQERLQKATESVIKCVQSKLVNYEQRLADMHLQYRQKIQENAMLESKVKAMDEDRKRLLKTVQSLQGSTDKFEKSMEQTKINLAVKTQALASLKKEMDAMKKEMKQKNGLVQSLQTRLDKCSEENRRLKSQHQSTQSNLKQQQSEDRLSMEELKNRLTQMEQQRNSLQSTIEKQTQLIKSLRSHKVRATSNEEE